MANLETLKLTINANADSAAKGLSRLMDSLTSLSSKVQQTTSKLSALNRELETLSKNKSIKFTGLEASTKKIHESTESLAELKSELTTSTGTVKVSGANDVAEELENTNSRVVECKESMDNLSSSTNNASSSMAGLSETTSSVKENASDVSSSMGELSKNVTSAKGNVEKSKSGFSKFTSGLKTFKNTLKESIPFLQTFSRIMRIASTMLIRTGVRAVFKGMKEGLSNYYEYAKANSLEYANSLDQVSSSWATLKNQMGASIAPAISAALPVINALASAATTAFNAVSQLIALLTGQSSWSKATNQVAEFGDAVEKTGSGGGGLNETLAAFDELNVIASESSGGGSGASEAVSDFENMFEEMYEFEGWIRDLVNFIKDNLTSIEGIAIAIGAAILAWKLADAFAESLPILSQLFGLISTGAVIAITAQLSWMFNNEYLKTGKIGWLIADLFTTAVGSTAAWAIANHFIGGNAGAWAAVITLTLSAVAGLTAQMQDTDVKALSEKAIIDSIENALKFGAAAFIVSKSILHNSTMLSLKKAGGVALITLGASIGIKAILDDEVELFSVESVKSAFYAAGLVGLGLWMTGAGWAISGGVALAVLLAYFGIKALTSKNKIEVDDNLIHLTEEQVNQYVRSHMFTVDPEIMIKVTSDNIQSITVKSKDIENTLSSIIGTLNVVNLGLATSDDYSTLKEQIVGSDGTGGLIGQITSWVEEAEQTGKLVLKFTPQLIGDTEEEQKAWYVSDSEGWKYIEEEMERVGKELADLFTKAQNDELVNNEPELLETYLNFTTKVASIMAGTDFATNAQIDFDLKLSDLDQSNINQALAEYASYKDQMTQAADELTKEEYRVKSTMIAVLKEMLTINPDSAELQAQLAEAEAGLAVIKKRMEKGLDDFADELAAPGREIIAEWIKNNAGTVNSDDFNKEWIESLYESSGMDFGQLLTDILMQKGTDISSIGVEEFINLGGWDTLTEEFQTMILSSLTLNTSTIKQLKSLLKLNVNDIINISGWNNLTDAQKMNLLDSLTQAYGADEVISAVKESGIDITDALNTGLKANIPTIKSSAQALTDAIKNKFSDPSTSTVAKNSGANTANSYKTGVNSADVPGFFGTFLTNLKNKILNSGLPEAGTATGTKTGDNLSTSLNNSIVPPTEGMNNVKVSMESFVQIQQSIATGFMDTLRGIFGGEVKLSDIIAPSDYGKAAENAVENAADSIEAKLNGINVDIPVSASISALIDATVTITPVIEGATVVNAVSNAVQNIGNIAKAVASGSSKTNGSNDKAKAKNLLNAGGAFGIDRGDVFIANEAGAELVGSINGRTSVANQEQIIEGIQRGVAEANSEQNSLLRQQNDLLRSILEKDTSVRLNASAALGRITRQSMDMYANMVGG